MTTHPLSYYASSRGIVDQETLELIRSKFGRNEFDVPQPTFTSLYKQQLVQPITVFQVSAHSRCNLLNCQDVLHFVVDVGRILEILDLFWRYDLGI